MLQWKLCKEFKNFFRNISIIDQLDPLSIACIKELNICYNIILETVYTVNL